MRRGGRAGVEQLGRPPPLGERTVVRPRFEEADAPGEALAEARREDAPGRAATDDDDVEPHRRRIGAPR
jgi:hypothetical protein